MTTPDGSPRSGRELAYAVLLCLAGAGLALFAATRAWAVEAAARPAPLPPVETARTGADLVPWLPPLSLVGLAGAGALLATRRAARAVVGAVVAACGLGVLAAAAYAPTAGAGAGWPAATALGGAALVGGGGLAMARGRRWPAMGARYERRPGAGDATGKEPGTKEPATADATESDAGRAGTVQAWDALDRGEDPTAG
jgi:hypothetical protein